MSPTRSKRRARPIAALAAAALTGLAAAAIAALLIGAPAPLTGLGVALAAAAGATAIAATIGLCLGLAAAMIGPAPPPCPLRDRPRRLAPPLLLALGLVGLWTAATGGAAPLWALAAILGLSDAGRMTAALCRAAMAARGRGFVADARLAGRSDAAIALRHVLPSIAVPLGAAAAASFCYALTAEAALSFLGLGAGGRSLGGMLATVDLRRLEVETAEMLGLQAAVLLAAAALADDLKRWGVATAPGSG